MTDERHDLDEPEAPTSRSLLRAASQRVRAAAADPTARVILILVLLVLIAHGYPWAPG